MSKALKRIAEKEVPDDLRPSLDIYAVAELLGCCTKTVVKMCKDGALPFHLVGNRRKFRPEDIAEFWGRKRIDRSEPTIVDSSDIKEERRKLIRQGSDADAVTLEEIRSLCRQ